MAADSGAFELSLKYTVKTPKIWRVDDALIGVSGSFRIMNAVRESGITDPAKIRDYVLDLRIAGDDDWQIAVADREGIHEIGSDHAVVEFRQGYLAIGAAAEMATGALWALQGGNPDDIVKKAVKACIEHHTLVSLPVTVLKVGSNAVL
jgi:hypothetical protein